MADADLWPPPPFDIAMSRFEEHDAWVRGDTELLSSIYSGQQPRTTHVRNGVEYSGGLVGALSKRFWGTPVPQDEKRARMHLPLAADICQLSADLLFGEPPKIRYPRPDNWEADDATQAPKKWEHAGQKRLDEILGSDQAHAELLKAGEYAAALGGAYLAVVWDKDLADHVFIRAYAADCAVPTFRYGQLVKVTLWSEYRREALQHIVYRLLETHTPGMVRYELRRGTAKTLGPQVPLTELSETAHYESLRVEAELESVASGDADLSVTVATGVDRLAVVYFPNMLPQTEWRKTATLAELGRSDLAGIEDLLDFADQVASSLARDVEIGQGRLIVPEQFLELSSTPGQGASFDMNREVFTPVGGFVGKADKGLSDSIHAEQFAIRDEEHENVGDWILRRIANSTGYSPAHLGVKDSATGTKTATEVTADFTDSDRTRDKKAMYVKPALARLAQVALAIDGEVFPGKGGKWFDELPDVEFSPVSQQDLEKAARITSAGYLSQSLSVRERVKSMHPDWDEDQIDDEVSALREEFGQPAPDPTRFTDDPDTPTGERPEVAA